MAAIWSFDLTDRDVVNIPGETPSEITDMVIFNEEGFGNDTDIMETVKNFNKSDEGVFAVASTTRSLKVLVEFLRSPTVNIPVRDLDIGRITPVEIRKVYKTSDGKRKLSTILAFEVDVTPEATQLAERLQVKVIFGGVLETLCQEFKEHVKETKIDDGAILPCVLSILPDLVFNKDNPIVLGVLVVKGFIKLGTPICNMGRDCLQTGRIAWIEKDQKSVTSAEEGEAVMIKIVPSNPKQDGFSSGRHFDISDRILISQMTRESMDALTSKFKDQLNIADSEFLSDMECVLNIK
ncbi:eukaryotic translation initiation factor 5B-like [Capsella rubella]|uniref:eukaryotic translation initiation factor 5B-like n=1 Tax=Capsella rubella TaxID=81985 RepID=UPI000CD4DBBD|nr:eukaryotic translation initiation factor 5B-like [Capsella rubella]